LVSSVFDNAAREGASGAMFWILTPDPQRAMGDLDDSARCGPVGRNHRRAHLFASLVNASPPPATQDGAIGLKWLGCTAFSLVLRENKLRGTRCLCGVERSRCGEAFTSDATGARRR